MSVNPKIEITADGSHTLFVPELNEHYHSVNGAMQESNHVFIDAGLHYCTKEEIMIFEVGFGTGLNAFLTLIDSQKSNKKIHYKSIETYPLDMEIIDQLNYTDSFSVHHRLLYTAMHKAEWGTEVEITPDFFLTKIKNDFTQYCFEPLADSIDLIYFDAFAPDKQPDMWNQQLFNQLYKISTDQAILVTYCAKGVVRRMLQAAGYKTERLPGPPGKREMLRATKIS